MTQKAVIFDMGGVLVRSMDRAPRTRLGERFGLRYEEIDALVFASASADLASVGAIEETAHWDTLRTHLGLSAIEMDDFRAQFWAGDQVDRGLLDFIQALRPGVRTGLLSNAWSGAREFLQQRYGLLNVFDTAIFSAEVKLAKPDPAIYQLMLERLGVTAQDAVFVDDFSVNVEAARSLGLTGVLFRGAETAIAEVQQFLRQ